MWVSRSLRGDDPLKAKPASRIGWLCFIDLRVSPAQVVDTMLRLDGKDINIPLELAWLVETVGDAYQVMQPAWP